MSEHTRGDGLCRHETPVSTSPHVTWACSICLGGGRWQRQRVMYEVCALGGWAEALGPVLRAEALIM